MSINGASEDNPAKARTKTKAPDNTGKLPAKENIPINPMNIGPKPGDRVTVNGQQGEVATRWPGWMSVELDDGSTIKVVLTRIQND